MKSRWILVAGLLLGAVAAASAARDGAVITNTGSTNVAGYTIKVWSDGTVLAQRPGASAAARGRIAASLAAALFAELRQAKQTAAANAGCMKSASFGSSTHVTYHGWTSQDLECPGAEALASRVHAIAAAVSLPAVTRRPMLPNEPRRPEPTAQPSASPDSTYPTP